MASPTSKNLYSPIEDLGPHPFKQQRKQAKAIDKDKSKLIKRALKEEATTAGRIARKTVGSGRVYGDGDLVVLENFRVEHKLRTTTKSYSVSAAEYEKGKRQGVGIYAIAVDNGDTCYFLTEDTFTELLAWAKKGMLHQID